MRRIHDRVRPILYRFHFGGIVPMLVQPPVVLGGRPCAGIQRGARPIVDDAMVLVEIRAEHAALIDPQMQELQPVVLVAETRIPSVGTRMRPAFRIDPAPTPITGPRPGPDAACRHAPFRPSSTHRRVKSCSTSPHPRRRRWPAGVRPTMRACTSRNARTTSRCQAAVGTNTGRSCVRTPNGPRARRRPSRTVRRGRRAGRG